MPHKTFTSTVHTHHWQGFRYASRVSHSAEPRFDPVVLIGGAMQRKEDWGRIEYGMLDHADVICADLPGWGEADLLPSGYSADLPAGALRHLIDDLGLERVNVLAGSYGTAIAYRLAQAHPERLARMVLVGTMRAIPERARPAMSAVLDIIAAGEHERLGQAAVDMLMCGDPAADIASAAVVKRILMLRFGNLGADELAKFVANTHRLLEIGGIDTTSPPRVPILFAAGEHETLTPPRLCRELAMSCSDSWFVEMGRADHLVHLERPAELIDLVARFLGRERLDDLSYANVVEDLRRVPALT